MSDLTAKFGTFEDQIAAQHIELLAALGGISSALGGAPTDTFADLVAAITAGNVLLAAIRADSNTKLNAIFNMLDTMNNNASLNAQRQLLLTLQLACPCDPDLPLLPPILDVTPTDLTESEKCQRIQYFLDLFRSFVINCATYLDDHGSISSFQIYNLLQIVLLERDITTGELRNISSSTRDLLASFLNSGTSPSQMNADLFFAIVSTDLLATMRQALYGADNAADGYAAALGAMSAYESTPGSGISNMFFSSWANVMYGEVPIVDATAYDGSVCAPPIESDCVTLHVFSDEGTWSYSYEGNNYGRASTGALSFAARIQSTTTIYSAMALTISVGGIVNFVPANTLISWAQMATLMGTPGGPQFIDGQSPTAGFEIEFCELLGEEL